METTDKRKEQLQLIAEQLTTFGKLATAHIKMPEVSGDIADDDDMSVQFVPNPPLTQTEAITIREEETIIGSEDRERSTGGSWGAGRQYYTEKVKIRKNCVCIDNASEPVLIFLKALSKEIGFEIITIPGDSGVDDTVIKSNTLDEGKLNTLATRINNAIQSPDKPLAILEQIGKDEKAALQRRLPSDIHNFATRFYVKESGAFSEHDPDQQKPAMAKALAQIAVRMGITTLLEQALRDEKRNAETTKEAQIG